jgi:hypothetical protein
VVIRERQKDGGECVPAPPLFLAPPLSFLRLRIDALPKVFAPFARDLPSLGERHGGVVAYPAWHRVRASRKAGDEHKRALIFLRAALRHADAKTGNLGVMEDDALAGFGRLDCLQESVGKISFRDHRGPPDQSSRARLGQQRDNKNWWQRVISPEST